MVRPIEPPVKKGDIKKLKVQAIGQEGDGVAKIDNYVIMIDKPVEIGVTYRVLIRKVLPHYAFAGKYFDKGGQD